MYQLKARIEINRIYGEEEEEVISSLPATPMHTIGHFDTSS